MDRQKQGKGLLVFVLICCKQKMAMLIESWLKSAYFFSFDVLNSLSYATLSSPHLSSSNDTLTESQRFKLWAGTLLLNFS